MNRKATIKRKLIAACLLAVLLVITCAKLLHSHEALSVATHLLDIEQIEKSSDCSVCDYHFTKDADFNVIKFAPGTSHSFSFIQICYESRITSSIGLIYADRGPPALV